MRDDDPGRAGFRVICDSADAHGELNRQAEAFAHAAPATRDDKGE
jgi:hypothetical protein